MYLTEMMINMYNQSKIEWCSNVRNMNNVKNMNIWSQVAWQSRLGVKIVTKYECENVALILGKKVEVSEYKKHNKWKTKNKALDCKDVQEMIHDK